MNAARHQRVSDIFLAAARADQSGRSAILDSRCGDDLELRREVESLLSHHDESSGAFETPVLGNRLRLADLAAEDADGQRVAEPITRIGRYRVLSVLGEGGMGVVYLAEQDNPRRTVALKVIRPGVITDRALRRFEHESQVLGRLQHRGIAHIHEAGMAELPTPMGPRAQPFFAMEYVRGRPLMDYAAAQSLSVRQRLALFAELCQAVHHAHQHGVIHRDLKPSNILVDEHGCPRILDFGVARSTDADVHATTLQTDIGQLIGTVPYMSPEQASGDAARVDARSDVYSLGVILYELLTGRLPHDLRGRTIPQAVQILATSEPAPLSSVNRSLRGDLNTIAAKALERDPSRRYQSASELALDVQRFLDDQPIIARPASAMYQFSKFARRNRALVAGVAAVFILLIAGLTTVALLLARAVSAESLATQRLQLAEKAGAQKDAVNDFMTRMLTAASPEKRSGDYTVVHMLDDAAAELLADSPDNPLRSEPEVEAVIRFSIASAYRSLGRFELAEPHAIRSVDLFRAMGDEHRADLAAALNNFGLIRQEQGRLEESLQLHQEALQLNIAHYGRAHKETASTLNNIGLTLGYMGRFDEAVASYRESLEARREYYGGDHDDVSQSLANLASLLRGRGRLDEAEPLAIEALEMNRRLHGPEHQYVAHCLNTLASIRTTQGRRPEAEALLREALAMRRKLLGEHPETAVNLNDLALCIKDQGRLDEAEPFYIESLALRRRTLDPDNPAIAQSLGNFAALRRAQGRLAEAEALSREALEIRRRRLSDDNPDVLGGLNNLALILQEEGKLDEAETLLRQCLDGRVKRLGPDHPDVAVSMINLATTLRDRKQLAEAESLARQSLAISQKVNGPRHLLTASTIASLASIVASAGDRPAEAESLARQALEIRRATLRSGHPDIARSAMQVASMLIGGEAPSAEDAAGARTLLEEALPALEKSLPAGHPQIALTRSLLGLSLMLQEQYEQAEPLLVSAAESLLSGASPGAGPHRSAAEAARRVIELYERSSRPEDAQRRRERIAQLGGGQ